MTAVSTIPAALVFPLAARHPADVVGDVAFSPREHLANKASLRDAARKVDAPV